MLIFGPTSVLAKTRDFKSVYCKWRLNLLCLDLCGYWFFTLSRVKFNKNSIVQVFFKSSFLKIQFISFSFFGGSFKSDHLTNLDFSCHPQLLTRPCHRPEPRPVLSYMITNRVPLAFAATNGIPLPSAATNRVLLASTTTDQSPYSFTIM